MFMNNLPGILRLNLISDIILFKTLDFMWDWASSTKYEGSFIGHTFVARRADDPSVVVDSYTLEPTKIIDCPRREQQQKTHRLAPYCP